MKEHKSVSRNRRELLLFPLLFPDSSVGTPSGRIGTDAEQTSYEPVTARRQEHYRQASE